FAGRRLCVATPARRSLASSQPRYVPPHPLALRRTPTPRIQRFVAPPSRNALVAGRLLRNRRPPRLQLHCERLPESRLPSRSSCGGGAGFERIRRRCTGQRTARGAFELACPVGAAARRV